MTCRIGFIPEQPEIAAATTLATPSTGFKRLYARDDGYWYELDDAGAENVLFGGILHRPHLVTQAAAQVISNVTPTIVDFDTTKITTTGYVLNANGSVDVPEDGLYEIDAKVSAQGTDGDRANIQASIFVDGAEELDSRAYSYHRNVATDEGTATPSTVVQLTAGQTVDVRALVLGDNVTTLAGESNFKLKKVDE